MVRILLFAMLWEVARLLEIVRSPILESRGQPNETGENTGLMKTSHGIGIPNIPRQRHRWLNISRGLLLCLILQPRMLTFLTGAVEIIRLRSSTRWDMN